MASIFNWNSGKLSFFSLLFNYIKPYKILIAIFLTCILIQSLYLIMLPFVYRSIFDDVIVNKKLNLLFIMCLILFLGIVIKTVVDIIAEFINARIAINVQADIRLELFNKLQSHELKYFKSTETGKIIAHFTNDIDAFVSLIGRLSFFVKYIIVGCAAFVLLIIFQWQLAIGCFLFLLTYIVISHFLSPYVTRVNDKRNECNSEFFVALSEFLMMQLIIRLFNISTSWQDRIKKKLDALAKASIMANKLNIIIPRLFALNTVLIEITIITIGAYMVIKGSLTIGTMFAFLTLFGYLRNVTDGIVADFAAIMSAMSGMKRVSAALHQHKHLSTRSDVSKPAIISPALLKQCIELRNVSFGYSDKHAIIHDLSLKIPAGQFVAFVGPSGSGKSTIISLLLGLYTPQQGAIFYDNTNLSLLDEYTLRQQVSIVLQDDILFNLSIRDNIHVGRPSASDQEIVEIANSVGLHESIMRMPNGYQTLVGERGVLLSSGQRQRIALARALIRNPQILILDEVTSSLDPIADREINDLIISSSLIKNRTTVMVTHRLKPVINAHTIFVLNQGKLIESGKHETLIKNGGLYAKLWKDQQSFNIGVKDSYKK